MARFVLVHGAFSGAWFWTDVEALLEASGHTVQAVDLPASGEDQTPPQDASLDLCAEHVAAALASSDEPAVLVGHSMGGAVITHTASLHPENIAALVYLCAFVPGDGKSLLDMTNLPEGASDMIQANLIVEPPIGTLPDEAARVAVFGECTDEQFAWAMQHRRPQALRPMGEPATRNAAWDALPKTYVFTRRDRSIPIALQRRMAREGQISRTYELDTDHAPQLSKTAEVAEILEHVAEETVAVA